VREAPDLEQVAVAVAIAAAFGLGWWLATTLIGLTIGHVVHGAFALIKWWMA